MFTKVRHYTFHINTIHTLNVDSPCVLMQTELQALLISHKRATCTAHTFFISIVIVTFGK